MTENHPGSVVFRFMEQRHNGWSNYETWNVQGLIDNMNDVNAAHIALIESKTEISLFAVVEFVQKHLVPLRSFRREQMDKVNWQELVDHWKRMRDSYLQSQEESDS